MKNKISLFALFILAFMDVKAQINLEHSFTDGVSTVHFSGGYKYYSFTRTAPNHAIINIYNLNYSLYKTISTPSSIPLTSFSNEGISIFNISDSLFNTSTSDIEYAVSWVDSANYLTHWRVFDDAGNTLFSKDSCYCGAYFTNNGWKYICWGNGSKVYGLPGGLPCDECVNHVLTGIASNPTGDNYFLNAFPNPTNGSVNINYQLPNGTAKGQIIFYDMQGKEIKRFIVDRTFKALSLSTSDISAGTYFYVLQTENGNVGSKKMVVIK